MVGFLPQGNDGILYDAHERHPSVVKGGRGF